MRSMKTRVKLSFHLILTLVVMLTMAQTAWADDEAPVYDLVTEVPDVDGGQSTNWNTEYDYYSLVDGDTYTIYGISNANPWVEFHYSRAFVPKKYILWTGDYYSFAYNPATWTIKAKLNETDPWTTLATVDNSSGNQLPENDHASKEFSIESNTNAYKYFRFEATRKNNGTFQLGELQFMESTEKTTATWWMNQGKGTSLTSQTDNSAEFTNGSKNETMRYTWENPNSNAMLYYGQIGNQTFFMDVLNNNLSVTFPYLKGTVTKVELYKLDFFDAGMKLSIGNGSQNLMNGNSEYCTSVDGSGEVQNVTFEGSVDVDTDHPLQFTFSVNGTAPQYTRGFGFWDGGYIRVTYIPAKTTDLGHNFTSITASGNTLTATCTSSDAEHNAMYNGANHQYTLTLVAKDDVADIIHPVIASFSPSIGYFNSKAQLGATSNIEYKQQGSNNWTSSAPNTVGDYTARATVRINSTDYVLTTNFSVVVGYTITNNAKPQLSVSPATGVEGKEITVTFTPKMGESVATLTVKGDNTDLSIGNGIIDNGDGTYMFIMPVEEVTLGATFTFPMDENNFAQDGDTYTIKNADGWNYFCQRMQYDANLDGFSGKTVELADNISVTTMAGTVRPFKGTFDGKGNTLNFNHTADAMYTAPFQNTNDATICNLHVTGLIEGGTNSYLGGLVGSSEGNLTIRDCHVSTQISSTISDNAGIGGVVGYIHYTTYSQKCQITGCVFDGLIYNPNSAGQTYGCGGFVGTMSQYAYVDLTDCLFIHGQYDNNGGKYELKWGDYNIENSTFFHRFNNQGEGTLTNCYYVDTHGRKQGAPAVESATAPTNFAHFGDPTTDYGFLKVYGHTMVFNNKYYTPTYGDLVEKYDYSGRKSYNIEYDDAPLGIPDIASPLWTEGLRYNRSFTAGKPVTIMLPFNFTRDRITLAHDNANPSGKFYEFKGIEENQDHKWVAVMIEAGKTLSNEVVETTLKANTPYLYVPAESTEYWDMYVGGYGINIFTEGNEGGTKETEYYYGDGMPWNHWKFKGTYQPRYWSETEHFEEVCKVYGFAGATKEVDGKLVEAGDFVRTKSGAKIRPTSCYLKWVEPQTGNAPALTRGAGSNNGLVLTLPEHFKILSVDGQPYTGNGQDLSQGSTIVIELEAGYSATNVVATQQSNVIRSTPPEEIPDYDDYLK